MPQCCRCNGNGRCRGCVCTKNKRVCTSYAPGRNGLCENQPVAISDSTQDNLSVSTSTTPESTNTDEIQPNQREESEVVRNGIADNGPDDHYHDQGTDTCASNGLLPAFVPMQSPTFRWGEIEGKAFAQAI